MKFSIKREELISILSEYTNILKENPIKPIVSGLQIKAESNLITFVGTNLEVDHIRKVEADYPDAEESMEKEREKIYSHALANEMKRVRGTTVHFFLENILHGSEEEIALAKELTFSRFASVIGEKVIKELLSDENIEYILNKNRKIFSDEWDFIFPEYEVFTEDKTFRIDRLMIKMPNEKTKGTVYIVDYKTGETDEEQIENYRHLIEKLLEERKMLEKFEIITEFIEFKL